MKKLPKDAWKYFSPEADREFKKKHPMGYGFLVALGMFVLVLPLMVLAVLDGLFPTHNEGFVVPAGLGALLIGIGLFNLVAKIIGQYLGDWVTLGFLGLGGVITGVSCWFLFLTDLRLNEKLLEVYFCAPMFMMLEPFLYMPFRSRMNERLKRQGLRERDIKRRKRGMRNYWWYEDLRDEVGGFYGINRFVTVFYPALLAGAVLLGWFPMGAVLVAAGHGLLSLCLMGMFLSTGRIWEDGF